VTRLRWLIGLGIAATALLIAAAPAGAASTRAEYVAQADPICQAGQAQERVAFKSYAKSIKRYLKDHPHPEPNRPSKAVTRLVLRHYSLILSVNRSVNSQLSSINPAAGDETAVAEWLQLRTQSADLLDRTVHAFHNRKVELAIRFYVNSIRRELQAELPIRDFGFQYCSSAPPDV
jgi:hypothetical protein